MKTRIDGEPNQASGLAIRIVCKECQTLLSIIRKHERSGKNRSR